MSKDNSEQNWPDLYAEHLEIWETRLSAGLAAAKFDAAVIFAGADKLRFRDDLTVPFFAVEPYFKAWVPLTRHPGSALRLAPGKRPLLILLREEGFWHETPENPSGYWVDHFDIREVSTLGAVARELVAADQAITVIGEPSSQTAEFTSVNDSTLLNYLDYQRAIKTPYEIRCLERANEIAATGHAAVQRAFDETPTEFKLHHAYCQASQQLEEDLPYPNIIALNEHGSILHYQNLRRDPPEVIRSFLIDAGAQCNGYASDVTRTYSRTEPEFSALITAMDSMQQALCDQAAPGTGFVSLNDKAHQMLGQVLNEQGLVRCSGEDAYTSGITRTFLPHGLGHLLGLQVHDAGGRLANESGEQRRPPDTHPMLRLTRTLSSGFVFTMEPGLYFIPSLLDKLRDSVLGSSVCWDKIALLAPCGGIRIEDDIHITDSEVRNLSRPALRTASEH